MMIDNRKRSENGRKKRFSRTRRAVRKVGRDVGSTAALAGYGALGLYLNGDIAEGLVKGTEHAFYAGKSASEVVTGGPESMRAVDRYRQVLEQEREMELEKALNIVDQAEGRVAEAANKMESFAGRQLRLVNQLQEHYRINETTSREIDRLSASIGGTMVEYTQAGDDAVGVVTGNVSKSIDDIIIDWAGKAIGAEENVNSGNARNSELLQRIYDNVLAMSKARDRREDGVEKTMDYLASEKGELIRQNEAIEGHINSLLGLQREGYKVEDDVLSMEDKVNLFKVVYRAMTSQEQGQVTDAEIDEVAREIAGHRGNVDEIRAEITQDIPIPRYEDPTAWMHVGIPLIVAGVGALAAKGLAKITHLDRPLTYAALAPYHLAKGVGKLAYSGGKRAVNLVRNAYAENKKLEAEVKAIQDGVDERIKSNRGEE